MEGRITQFRGQLTSLRGQVRRARGTARVRLARLERRASTQLDRLGAAAERSREHLTDSLEKAQRRVENLIRVVEPVLHRSLQEARRLEAAGETARRIPRGLKAGLVAGRQAYRRALRP